MTPAWSVVVWRCLRACLRWTRQGLVRRSRFQCGNLPSELAALDLPIELVCRHNHDSFH